MLNSVSLLGRLTNDLEIKRSKINNKKYCNNTIAVDRGKDESGQKKEAMFVNFTIWENNAEYLVKYAKKGGRVLLSGYLDQTKQFNYEKNINEYELIFKVKNIEIIDWSEKKDNIDVNKSGVQTFKANDLTIENSDLPW